MRRLTLILVVLLLLSNIVNSVSAIDEPDLVDITAPEVSISVPSEVQNAAFDVVITFTEEVSNFKQINVTLSGTATVSITSFTTEDNKKYTATITPTASGTINIDVAADVTRDAEGNGNIAAQTASVTADMDPPTLTITAPNSTAYNPNNATNSFDVLITFSETVSDFTESDVQLTFLNLESATITSWTPNADNTGYTATISIQQLSDCDLRHHVQNSMNVRVSVPSGVAMDVAGNLNAEKVSLFSLQASTFLFPLGLSASVPSDVQTGAFEIGMLFSLSTEDFIQSDVTLSGAAASITGWRQSGTNNRQYYATITPTESGTITITIPAGAAHSAQCNENSETSQTVTVDLPPGVSITTPTDVQNGAFDVSVIFTEEVSDFEQTELVLDGTATASITSFTTTDNITYTAEVTPTTDGTVTINVPAGVATDGAGNDNLRATERTTTVDLPPTVTLRLTSDVQDGVFDVLIGFSERVSGFEQVDIVLGGTATASVTRFTTTDSSSYTATITATTSGDVTINVPAGVSTDNLNHTNTAATEITVAVTAGIIVDIPDANLAAVLRSKLSLDEDADITPSQMTKLVHLSFGGGSVHKSKRIQDLTGLEYATNLQTITLHVNRISNISALENLTNLTKIDLRINRITDISALKNLTNLTLLELRRNQITDISPLSGLTNLTRGHLRKNAFLDTSPIYPLLRKNGGKLRTDIDVSEYPPWDVNEDGSVNDTDSSLVTAAIGQTGDDIVNARTDVDGDGDVDADDLLLVTENIDGTIPAPLGAGNIGNLFDTVALETLDRDVIKAQLDILRANSDGSAKYLRAIAMLENILAASRPKETTLLANYPNPFNPETWIPYHLANTSAVRITIYDVHGTVVRRLELGHQREGYYTNRSRSAYWDGRNDVGERVASGIYFYRLEADNVSLLRKMVILK